MIRRWLFIPIAATFSLASNAAAEGLERSESIFDPLSLYGPAIDFDVFRKGDKVGFHQVRFEKAGEDLVVFNRFQLEIEFLFFTAYSYVYQSTARWREDILVDLKADVDDGGNLSSVEAVHNGEHMTVSNADGRQTVDTPLFPTNHWNASVLPQNLVLNTLTGRINNVAIEPRGREEVSTEQGDVTATRYAYTGDLGADVWYDDAGRWVKLRFEARDGSVIDYVCKRCQGPVVKQAER
jgi:hypothetical protein